MTGHLQGMGLARTCKELMTVTLSELLLEIFMQRQRTSFPYISS